MTKSALGPSLICILISLFLCVSPGYSIRCFKCNQRIAKFVVCQNATFEDCQVVFPQQLAVCTKTVQRFANNQPPWVLAQCQIQAAINATQINTCVTSQLTATVGDTLETCFCSRDLCNSALSKFHVNYFQWILLSTLLFLR